MREPSVALRRRSAPVFGNDDRAASPCNFQCAIYTARVDNQYLVAKTQRTQTPLNDAFFIFGNDDCRNIHTFFRYSISRIQLKKSGQTINDTATSA